MNDAPKLTVRIGPAMGSQQSKRAIQFSWYELFPGQQLDFLHEESIQLWIIVQWLNQIWQRDLINNQISKSEIIIKIYNQQRNSFMTLAEP